MSFRRTLAAGLDVRPDEERLVVLLLVHSFLLGIPRVLTSAVAMALFLSNFDATDLPFVYLGAATAVPLAGFLRLRLAARLPLARLLLCDLGIILAMLVLLRLALASPGAAHWIAFGLPVWYEVEWVLLSLEFDALAGSLLNVRQGKRLFGLIGSGELIAGGLAGSATPWLVERLGTPNLLIVSAGAVLACLVLVAHVSRRFEVVAPRAREARRESQTRFRELLHSRYLTLLFALVALSYLGYYVVDNAFYTLARAGLPDAEQLASFLGVFWAIVSLATLGARTLLSARVLTRYGILGGLLALPAALAAGVSLTALSGAFVPAGSLVFGLLATTRLLDQVLRDSIDRNTLLVLYQPLPARQRVRAQTAVEGIVGPIAGGLAGLVLLALVKGLKIETLPLISLLLVLVVGWAAVAVWVRREYTEVLAKALAGRRLAGSPLVLDDSATRTVLQQGLQSPHAGEVAYCLNVLEEIRHPALEEFLVELTLHRTPEVRRDAWLRIERLGLESTLPVVRRRVEEEREPAVRAAALRALAALGEAEDIEVVMGHADDLDATLRLGALVGLLRSGSIEGVLVAGERLVTLSSAEDAGQRVFAARLIGEVGERSFYRPLLRLLTDADLEVRGAAIVAAGRIANPRLWGPVFEGLADSRLRPVAMAALTAGGEAVLGQVEAALDQALVRRDRAGMRRLARLAAQTPGPRALELLWHRRQTEDPEARHVLLLSLALRAFSTGAERVGEVAAALEREMGEGARLLASAEDLNGLTSAGLVVAALDHAFEQVRERVLSLLSFVYPRETIWKARANLRASAAAQRAQAVELIDSLLSQEQRELVLPLIEELPRAERLTRLGPRGAVERLSGPERLARLARGDNAATPWIRANALQAAVEADVDQAVALVRGALLAPEAVVRETAEWLAARRISITGHAVQEVPMLSTIEKVIILKSVSVFAETPDEVLSEVAGLLEEVEVEAGESIFDKGDMGSALYIVVDGQVRVHSEGRTLRELGERDIFGEMAALDPEPRSASVTAVTATRLFRLEQEALYELMADRIEVARGVIRVLCRRLRALSA